MAFEMQVQPMSVRESTFRGIPGALGLLGAIGFGVGVVDAGFREQLFGVLIGCLVVAVLFGAWGIRLHQTAKRTLRVVAHPEGVEVSVVDVTLRAPTIEKGFFYAFTGRRRYPLAWIRLDDGTRSIVVRKGLGIHESIPHWPEGTFSETTIEPLYGDPVKLDRALARAMKV